MKHDNPDARNRYLQCVELTESPGWRVFFDLGFKPEVRRWKNLLMYDVDLSNDERKGLVHAISKVKEGFYKAYENTGVKIPSWLRQEFETDYDGY